MTGTQRIYSTLLITVITLSLLLGGCGDYKQRLQDARQEVDRLAKKINKTFVTVRNNTVLRKEIIENAYENMDQYDLSIEGMDVSEGGFYTWFEDYVYYPVEDKFDGKGMLTWVGSETGLYIDPEIEYKPENFDKARRIAIDGPEMVEIKQEIRLWEHILLEVVEAGEKPEFPEVPYFANPRLWLNMFGEYFDYVSTINPKLTQEILGHLEWTSNGAPYGNPDGIPKWTIEPYVHLLLGGWIESVSVPVYCRGKYKGLMNSYVVVKIIIESLIQPQQSQVLLIGTRTSLLGISASAKNLLDAKEVTDYDYLEQLAKYVMVEDEFKLTHDSQQPYTQEIGRKILAGEKEFEVEIKGKTYTVLVGDIPEVNFYVVGLVEK